ncbi:MAG: tetratricopeptide repeat protein [Candidatus Thalassarchaeaceae archaeon]
MSKRTNARLQHPRRSLGNRHRAQANKFLNIAKQDTENRMTNLNWAEQSSRQSVLHDFTNEDNWRQLIKIKILLSDEIGIRAVLEDLFVILGRNPERTNILTGIDLIEHGNDLLEAAFDVDPLDPDKWYTHIACIQDKFEDFSIRMNTLDLRDPRANIVFGRRIEKLFDNGRHDEFIPMARRIVAQRPQNHEAWMGLGRLHERRNEYDDAWFCYDQAQTHFPSKPVRDEYRNRMDARLDGQKIPWSPPDISSRTIFLNRMYNLSKPEEIHDKVDIVEEDLPIVNDEDILKQLLDNGEVQSALFLSRRLIANGDEWAQKYYDIAMSSLS